jgi:uncharacterized membrane protein YqhA
MFRALLRIRYLAAAVALVFALHAAGFFVLGLMRAYEGYALLLRSNRGGEQGRPGVHFAESVDALLFSLVMLVLALGTASLFLTRPGTGDRLNLPKWMRIRSLTELKLLLWEAILATLVVTAATSIIGALPRLDWTHLMLPAVILVLSISYYLLKRTETKREPRYAASRTDRSGATTSSSAP